MPTDTDAPANPVLEGVLALLDRQPKKDDHRLVADFARAYLRRIPADESRSVEEWFQEVVELFGLIANRTEPVVVRVFNPEDEIRGTVLEINVDDSPFLLDSITNEVAAHGLEVVWVIHPVIGVDRDEQGRLTDIGHARHARKKESVQHYQLDRRLFEGDLPGLERSLRSVLADVRAAVHDFYPMMDRVNRMVELARRAAGFYPEGDIGEAIAFLQWLRDNNYVFLGYREYQVVERDGKEAVKVVPETGLGILAEPSVLICPSRSHSMSCRRSLLLATRRATSWSLPRPIGSQPFTGGSSSTTSVFGSLGPRARRWERRGWSVSSPRRP